MLKPNATHGAVGILSACLLASCGPTHFAVPQGREQIGTISCDGRSIPFPYASSPDDIAVFLDLDNTGGCPMEIVRESPNGREVDRFTVPGMQQAFVRLENRGDFTLRVSCPANANATSCGGSLRFVAQRKGKADAPDRLREWVLAEGDQVSTPMACSDPGRELRYRVMNRGGEAIPVKGTVENTGDCMTFGVDVRDAGMQVRHIDEKGGGTSEFSFTVAGDKEALFWISCTGADAKGNCDGRVRLVVPAK